MTEFWEKSQALEAFSSEEKGHEYKNGYLYTKFHGSAKCVELETGKIVGSAETEEDPILSSTLDGENQVFYTAHKSKLIRAWKGPNLEPDLDFPPMKCDHKGPIILIQIHGKRLITASAESVLKVWNLEQRHCSGVLRNCSSLPLVLEYEDLAKIAICGTNSGAIHAWNCDTNELIATGSKHFSQVSALKSLPQSKTFVSAGRDKTLVFWSWNLQPLKVIPVFEELETLEICDFSIAKMVHNDIEEGEYFLASGEKGKIRCWNGKKMTEILSEKDSISKKGVLLKDQKVNQVLCCPDKNSVVIFQDDLLSICELKEQKLKNRTLCANQHEVLDMTIVQERFLVVATMSSIIKVYDLQENNRLFVAFGGHSESVLALNSFQDYFVSCGKDHSVCLWKITEKNVKLIAKGSGHSSYVGAIATSEKSIFSASKDGILKVWKIPSDQQDFVELQTTRTLLAHDSEINSVSVSLDNEFVATASQDKTCKIWRLKDMNLVKVLTGHRRGIWKVKFSQNSIWTASADSSIKLWSSKTFANLATFEGHLAAVLDFANLDEKRLASVASDGLLKVWETKTGTELGTFDAHEDKIWAVTYAKSQIITSGRDGNIFFWSDKTQEKKAEEREKANQVLKEEQTLANYVHNGQLSKALRLSLRLDKPRQAKRLLNKLENNGDLEIAVTKLDLDLKNILLKYVHQWNTIGGSSCQLAQQILQILLTEYLALDKDNRPYKVDSRQLSGLLAYSDKHYKRLDKLESRLSVVDLLLKQM